MIAHLPQKLVAEQVAVLRGNREVVRDISFTAGRGEALILTGANGVGKTTLLRAIAGFLPLASGTVRLDGGGDVSVGESCHYIGHLNGVKRSLTVLETLRFFSAFLGGSSEAAEVAAARLELEALTDIPAGYLSAGQKRRLALARLVCAARPVWLLDEPTVSLDTPSQDLLAGIVNEHLEAGGIVIAATHIRLGWENTTRLSLERKAGAHAEAS
jgi:heme exporter protein A